MCICMYIYRHSPICIPWLSLEHHNFSEQLAEPTLSLLCSLAGVAAYMYISTDQYIKCMRARSDHSDDSQLLVLEAAYTH